jgi:hypothetical protein
MSETAELSATVRDLQTSLDRKRKECEDWRKVASDLVDYYVYGTGTSACVSQYTTMRDTGRLPYNA